MKTRYIFCVVLALASTASGWLRADQAEDEAAIRKAGATYVEAFNQQDA